MAIEIKVPSVGESVQEAILAEWFKEDGDTVKRDEPIFVLETDKITLEVNAEADGILRIQVPEGETVAIGTVVGMIETETGTEAETPEKPAPKAAEAKEAAPSQAAEKEEAAAEKTEPTPTAEPAAEEKPAAKPTPSEKEPAAKPARESADLPPSVRRMVTEYDIDTANLTGTGPAGRITKGDVVRYLESRKAPESAPKPEPKGPEKTEKAAPVVPPSPAEPESGTRRKPMSPIRKRIAARLVGAKQSTAMLTTFNDIDMSRAMEMRSRYKEAFQKKHEVSLGFMSFFIKASVEALKEFPEINAFIEGDEIVYHDYYHIGIAVGSPRGLVVPVLRHTERLGFADIEKAIIDYVKKIKDNRLELSDLEGGTFTITNGGVFGSMLSTPILNTPQSGILGMHRIEKRPVVVDDEIVIRPMMYVALSYDHRIVDGREAVTFLRRIKEFVENPERMLITV
ncbi:MAG: 2-oxoglutarate dehydrogenase complex dihydrolipoyllysine-residue succinyltransferase [Thermodesulfobacteriota bacterium]